MARGDPIFARLDISLLWDPRIRTLTATQKWFYVTCSLCAVEARSELLPPEYNLAAIRDRAGVDPKTARKCLEKSLAAGLLEETPEGRVRVMGVRSNHPKLLWKDDNGASPHGADIIPQNTIRDSYETNTKEEESAGAARLGGDGAPPSLTPARRGEASIGDVVTGAGLDVPPPDKTWKKPTKKAVAEAVETLERYAGDKRELIGLAIGVASFDGPHKVFEEAMKLPPGVFLDCCGYAQAWRMLNNTDGGEAGAVLTNKFKDAMKT